MEVGGTSTQGSGQGAEGSRQKTALGPEHPIIQPGLIQASFDAHRDPVSASTTPAPWPPAQTHTQSVCPSPHGGQTTAPLPAGKPWGVSHGQR